MTQAWTGGTSVNKRKRFAWRKLVLPTLIPFTILGGLLAAFAVPAVNQRLVVLSLFMEPIDGVVVGVNGPHRYFACTPIPAVANKDSGSKLPVAPAELRKSADEYNDIDSLAQRLKHLRRFDNLVLVVSAVAKDGPAGVQLLPASNSATAPEKTYLQDLMRVVSRTNSRRRLVVLDVKWQTIPASDSEPSMITNHAGQRGQALPDSLHSRLCSIIQTHCDEQTTYVLTAGPSSWANGMEAPRESAFLHYWKQALSSQLADENKDGRLSIREALAYVRQRLAAWSTENCQFPQNPVLIGDADFDLGPIQANIPESTVTPSYPDWLLQAWQKRDSYLARYDIAANADFLDQWQRKLLAIESRWRRAINDLETEAEAVDVNSWADQQILTQIQQASANRPDSFLLAAKTTQSETTNILAESLADQIIKQLQQIKTLPLDPATEKAVDPILAATLKDVTDDQKLLLLDTLIGKLSCDNPFDPVLAVTTAVLAKQLKVDSSYAETLALQQIIAAGPPFDELDQALLRLTRLRSQLGERPGLFAVMSPRLDYLLNECLTAEQFYWLYGFTTEENVRRQVAAALTRVEVGLSQQQCIEQAISTVEQAIAFLRCGEALPHHESSFFEILDTTERLAAALYMHSTANNQATIDSIAIRFESIRYLAELLQSDMENLLSDTVAHADTCSCDALLCIVPATVRPKVYAKLLQGKNLQATVSATHPCNHAQEQASTSLKSIDGQQNLHISYADLISRIAKVESIIGDAQDRGSESMGAWLQHLAQSVAVTHDPSGFYQGLANRMTFRSGSSQQPRLAFQWSDAPISWQNRKAQLLVSLPGQVPGKPEVKLNMLDTASSSLKVVPSGTTATAEEPGKFLFELGVRSNQETPQPVKGVWICGESRGAVQYIPVRFPEIQSCQLVELNMHGCQIDHAASPSWRIWPKKNAQSFDWTLVNHDNAIRNVIVTVKGDDKILLQSAILPLPPATPQPIRFPSPAPNPLDASKAELQTPLRQLAITVSDAKSNDILLERSLDLELVDVRSCLQLLSSEFSVLDHGGANRLSVQLKGTPAADPLGHQIQLGLNSLYLPALLSIGSGNTTVQLSPKSPIQTLALKNLSIEEGPQSLWNIPLIVDGDAEVFHLSGLTPYSGGTIDWQLETEPKILLNTPGAALPGSAIQVQVGGINMPYEERLSVKFGQQIGGRFIVYHQVELPAPRASEIRLSSGGPTATVNLQAYYDRWNISLPTELVNGQYEVRASSKTNETICASSTVLLDDAAPVVASVTTEPSDLTKIYVQTIPGPSGIATVSMLAADRSRISAVPQTVSGDTNQRTSRWLVQAKQPVSLREQTVVTIEVTSNAGKMTTVDLPVKIETPSTLGTLDGIVVEGSIPQPNIAVTIRGAAGKQYQVLTDADGAFRCSLPAGDYQLSTEKQATGRRAESAIKMLPNKTTPARLELLLPKTLPRA